MREEEAERTQGGAGAPTFVKVRKVVRTAIPVGIFVLLIAGVGSGTLCDVGYDAIAYVCPVGALESVFSAGAPGVRIVIALAIFAAIALLLGKAFCSWACPIPPLNSLFSSAKQRNRSKDERKEAAKHAEKRWEERTSCGSCATSGSCASCTSAAGVPALPGANAQRRRFSLDSRHLVLAGAMGSAFVCGFPVFCLVCPVGLTFATGIALYRLAGFNEPTIDLLVFPVILILELTLLRKWCHRFCPIGALFSLLGRFAKITQPKVRRDACLRSSGTACAACAAACPEHIDPCDDLGDRPLSECTRCGSCVQACPKDALYLTGLKPAAEKSAETARAKEN